VDVPGAGDVCGQRVAGGGAYGRQREGAVVVTEGGTQRLQALEEAGRALPPAGDALVAAAVAGARGEVAIERGDGTGGRAQQVRGVLVEQQGGGEQVAVDPRRPVVEVAPVQAVPPPVVLLAVGDEDPAADLGAQAAAQHGVEGVERFGGEQVDAGEERGGLGREEVDTGLGGVGEGAAAPMAGGLVGGDDPAGLLAEQEDGGGEPGAAGEVGLLVRPAVAVPGVAGVDGGGQLRPGPAGVAAVAGEGG